MMASEERKEFERRLAEVRRKLGPLTQAPDAQPFRVNDATLAIAIVEVVALLQQLLAVVEGERIGWRWRPNE